MNLKRLVGCAALALVGVTSALAQTGTGWQFECWYQPPPPEEPPPPYSPDYNLMYINNGLFGVSQGVSGTAHWGSPDDQPAPCFSPEEDIEASGRLSFIMGDVGSIQSDFDDGLALSMGAPFDPIGDFSYVLINKGGNEPGNGVLYGDGGLNLFFVGASKRYFKSGWADEDVSVLLTVRNVGDAAILHWNIQNLLDEVQPLGLTFALWAGMHTSFNRFDSQTGASMFFTLNGFFTKPVNSGGAHKLTPEGFTGYFVTPTTRPIRNPHKFVKTSPRFPAWVQALAGQTEAYGIHLTNIPDATMTKLSVDPLNSNLFLGASPVDLINIGDHGNIMAGNTVSYNVFGDNTGLAEEADIIFGRHSVVQRYNTTNVPPLGRRNIVQLVKANWGVGNYGDPYAAVVDAPKLINHDAGGQDGLDPNPFTVRAYIDNQYAKIDQTVNMPSARFIITLPQGLSLVAGETEEKTLGGGILANALGFVEWQVESDGNTFGEFPITVTFIPTPGPQKVITTTVRVAATPRMRIATGPQMVTFPYTFADTSLGAILGLTPEVDFQAYKWDPGQGAYLQASTAIRGESVWIVPANDEGYIDLNGASIPADTPTGGMLTTLKKGWNMIGNPYNYAVPLADLVGVVDDSPADSYTWSELIVNGFVNSAVVTWDRGPTGDNPNGVYKFTTSQSSKLEPHKGYWIYVNTFNPVRLVWPPVLIPGLSDSGRADEEVWNTEKQWRIQLSARTSGGSDVQNWVGYTNNPQRVPVLTWAKPPKSPDMPIEMVIEGTVQGQPARVAQAITDKKTKTEFRVHVNNANAGDVTITWPNLPSIPRNVRAKLTDVATGEVRDLRAVSGYTYYMSQPGTREFTITLEQAGSSRPTIGNVLVAQDNRSGGAMTISYALSADALVSVRVLSASGKEVFTVTRGRADNSGENQVLWNLRDNANRAVAPGTYRVEILAETPDGERVRKIVPVNVIR